MAVHFYSTHTGTSASAGQLTTPPARPLACPRSIPYGRRILSNFALIQVTEMSSFAGRTSLNSLCRRPTLTIHKKRGRLRLLRVPSRREEENAYFSRLSMKPHFPCASTYALQRCPWANCGSSLLQKTSLPAILDMKWSAHLNACLKPIRDISQVPCCTFRQSHSCHRRLRGRYHASYPTTRRGTSAVCLITPLLLTLVIA